MRPDRDSEDGVAAANEHIRSLLSQFPTMPVEPIEPPAEVWNRIEAAVAAANVKTPTEAPLEPAANTIVEYWINADDVLVEVGESWAEFAGANGAPEQAEPPSDRTLWSYFSSEEIREIWQLLVERVRNLQKAAQVPLRCDAADARRWFEMTITPSAEGMVGFRCVCVFEEARPTVHLLDPQSERDGQLEPIPLCSWCGRGNHDSSWLDVEELVRSARLLEGASMPPLSYGICAPCRDGMAAELLVSGQAGGSAGGA